MAVLKNNTLGDIVVLNTHHVFGRNQFTANTHIQENDVSKSHATIFWKCGIWYIKDHSRNGTLINGKYITHTTVKLSKGDTVQYGRSNTTKWEMVDDDTPSCYLKSLTYENKILSLSSCLELCNEEDLEITFYCTQDMKWKAEKGGKTIELFQGITLEFNNEEWMFIENSSLDETIDYRQIIDRAYFVFTLSADEENSHIKIVMNELELDLGTRVHNYLLLTLARQRLSDANLGYVFDDQGWVSLTDLTIDLTKEFGKEIDIYYVNLQIHRLRKFLIKLEPYGYLFSNVIERKNGKIRFVHRYFKIIKEGQAIGEILSV